MKLPAFLVISSIIAVFTLSSCTTTGGRFRDESKILQGKMSFYSIRTNGGRHTASGERLSKSANTAAHKTLPMGTMVKVTNLVNGRSEVVRITDRGPYIQGRIIDLTVGVAKKLDFINAGVVPTEVEILD